MTWDYQRSRGVKKGVEQSTMTESTQKKTHKAVFRSEVSTVKVEHSIASIVVWFELLTLGV